MWAAASARRGTQWGGVNVYPVIRRTTIELDDDLLHRAMRALGTGTKRATVEEALRRVSQESEADEAKRRVRSIATLSAIGELERSQRITRDEMWR